MNEQISNEAREFANSYRGQSIVTDHAELALASHFQKAMDQSYEKVKEDALREAAEILPRMYYDLEDRRVDEIVMRKMYQAIFSLIKPKTTKGGGV